MGSEDATGLRTRQRWRTSRTCWCAVCGAEGVEYVFGIPGEENIRFVDALNDSGIRYVLVRHEQAASFMAEIYGRLTGGWGGALGDAGPGAINLLLGTADAMTNSAPLVALAAQGRCAVPTRSRTRSSTSCRCSLPSPSGRPRSRVPDAVPEITRKAFKTAQSQRPGAVFLAVPEDIEAARSGRAAGTLADRRGARRRAVLLADRAGGQGAHHGTASRRAGGPRCRQSRGLGRRAVRRGAEHPGRDHVPRQGRFPGRSPERSRRDRLHAPRLRQLRLRRGRVLICVGYEIQEFDPVKINPNGDKRILHVHRFPAEVDAHYPVAVGVKGDPSQALDALAAALSEGLTFDPGSSEKIRTLLDEELQYGRDSDAFPLVPQRVVTDVRAALDRHDIVLADTGAGKMWMAFTPPMKFCAPAWYSPTARRPWGSHCRARSPPSPPGWTDASWR